MKEITNRGKSPLQLMVRSHNKAVGFTTKILPGKGKGHNVCVIEDEDYTDQIEFLKEKKLISVKDLSKKQYIEALNSK